MTKLKIRANAKVNLVLDVVKKRPDGYHQVDMIMQTIGLCDYLTLEKIPTGIELAMEGEDESGLVPMNEENLIYRTAVLIGEHYPLDGGVRITLEKNIPVAAGMAGGSTDAAAVFRGMNTLFDLNMTISQMQSLGVKIGADVPYCIMGGTARAEGIGEQLTGLKDMMDCIILVAKPDISVSTKYVYENLHVDTIREHPQVETAIQALENDNLLELAENMENLLEKVTITKYPVITAIKNKMEEKGAVKALMSGSGPTVFGIFTGMDQAEAAYRELETEFQGIKVFITHPEGGCYGRSD